jgi:hypothetical protein
MEKGHVSPFFLRWWGKKSKIKKGKGQAQLAPSVIQDLLGQPALPDTGRSIPLPGGKNAICCDPGSYNPHILPRQN